MDINQNNHELLQRLVAMCYKIFDKYSWLLDAYVSDFYSHNHWYKLPVCWREVLQNLELETIADIIDPYKPLQSSQVLPLSLLSLRESVKYLAIPRKQQCLNSPSQATETHLLFNENLLSVPHFQKTFWKRVKMKKKHEIEIMSQMCCKSAEETNCYYIIDVGSGLGHLSRMLSYGYGLKVCGLEAQKYLSDEARRLDQEVEDTIGKYFIKTLNKNLRPVHINLEIETTGDGDDILKAVREAFGTDTDNLNFGIVGLHPCGDLGPTLLRLFIKSPYIAFINIVGCCYMKLSTSSTTAQNGYPLSTISKQISCDLSYCAREVACHALEAYVQKLQENQSWQLKIHAYRAALEKLIVKNWPDMYHSQVSSVKCSRDLTFSDYCDRATTNLNIKLNKEEVQSEVIHSDLIQWKNVVSFYSLRLMIAPLVETVILLDRLLYVTEHGSECQLIPIFDPHVSPRNQVLTAIKCRSVAEN